MVLNGVLVSAGVALAAHAIAERSAVYDPDIVCCAGGASDVEMVMGHLDNHALCGLTRYVRIHQDSISVDASRSTKRL
jgi:hypothetical protein